MPIYIYGLRCPLAEQIRYIGKSDDPTRRLCHHIGLAPKERTHKACWLRKLQRLGLKPEMIILREVEEGGDWAQAERDAIAEGRKAGWPLTNMTKGGDGAALTPEARKIKTEIMGRPETRAKMSAAAKARWSDPEKRAAGAAANKNENQRAGCRRRATPEYRAMMAAKSKAAWSDPAKRARIVAGITPEVRAKVSAASKAMWENPEIAKVCAANLTYRRRGD